MLHESKSTHLDAIGLPVLRTFRAVVRTGSFTRAGREVGLSQSAVSRAISQLEDLLGVVLFERTTRRVEPTPAGLRLAEEIGTHLEKLESVLTNLSQIFGNPPPIVKIGICRSVSLAYLPGLFRNYTKAFPDILVETTQAEDHELTKNLAEGKLDVAVVTASPKVPTSTRPAATFADPYVLIVPESSELGTNDKPISLRRSRTQFANQRWLGLPESDPASRLLTDHFTECGIEYRPALTADSYDLLINLVSLDMGIACVPNRALAIYRRQRRFRAVQIRPRYSRELLVLTRKTRQLAPPVQGFLDHMLFALQ